MKGYFGNIGKTERGIKYLGSRVAEFIIDLVTEMNCSIMVKLKNLLLVTHWVAVCRHLLLLI